MKYLGADELSAALEEKIRQARFFVQVSEEDEAYGYLIDRAQDDTVLGVCLPLEDVLRRCNEMRARPYRYMWAKATTDPNYYGFGAAVVYRPSCGGYALLMVPAEHAQWQLRRLQSGLENILGKVYDTAADALLELAEGRALGVL